MDRNGKVHTGSSTGQMTMYVYCGMPRWRYASRQDLYEKCGRFPPRGLSRPETQSHNDRVTKIAVITFKPTEFKVKLDIHLTIVNRLTLLS